MSSKKAPPRFNQVKKGDRWVEFAYIRDQSDEEKCSLVTGFYECTREAWHGKIPRNRRTSMWNDDWDEEAWMIQGKLWGKQPKHTPVTVPPINEILGRTIFGRGAIIPGLSADDLERFRQEAINRQLDPTSIPLLQREPQYEMEVLAIVANAHKQLGIDKIIDAQPGFPDMLACVNGKEVYFELELDSLGFWHHWNDLRRIKGRKDVREAKVKNDEDDTPVAVLCWVDGDKDGELKKSHRHLRVFELQSLLREGRKIEW